MAVIIGDCAAIEPAPANGLEVGEVGLPEFVQTAALGVRPVRCPDQDMGWAVIGSSA